MFKGLPDVSQDICSGEDQKQPLRLAFEAREGEQVVTGWVKTTNDPIRLTFEAREGGSVVVW